MAVAEVHYRVRPEGWNADRPMRIVMIADLHACRPFMGPDRISAIVDQAQALAGDLIVLLGDYVGHIPLARRVPPGAVANALARLRAPLGVWAVFGNHDWYDAPGAAGDVRAGTPWHRAFSDAGIAWLENASTRLHHSGQGFTLAGLGSQRAVKHPAKRAARGVDDLDLTLQGADPGAPVILLAHEPDIFADLSDRVGLTLSGHTHGGQIAPFGWMPVVPSKFGARYGYGHIREDGRDLIVSGGLGCTAVPVRIGRPPELTVVEVAP